MKYKLDSFLNKPVYVQLYEALRVLSGETTLEVCDAAPKQPHLVCDSIEVLGELVKEAHGLK